MFHISVAHLADGWRKYRVTDRCSFRESSVKCGKIVYQASGKLLYLITELRIIVVSSMLRDIDSRNNNNGE
jgi:tRNA(Phe) wybutosine-synthesizing methylase Tyw3